MTNPKNNPPKVKVVPDEQTKKFLEGVGDRIKKAVERDMEILKRFGNKW